MNIFYLSTDIKKCAEYHTDKHTVKMILEYSQLLSTAHRVIDGYPYVKFSQSGRRNTAYRLANEEMNTKLYSATHINHPSAVWVRQSAENYMWLCSLLDELCREYTYRYGKIHKIERDGLLDILYTTIPKFIPRDKSFTEPTPAMDTQYIIKGDSIASYRNYYKNGKKHLHSWKNRNVPEFITQ